MSSPQRFNRGDLPRPQEARPRLKLVHCATCEPAGHVHRHDAQPARRSGHVHEHHLALVEGSCRPCEAARREQAAPEGQARNSGQPE